MIHNILSRFRSKKIKTEVARKSLLWLLLLWGCLYLAVQQSCEANPSPLSQFAFKTSYFEGSLGLTEEGNAIFLSSQDLPSNKGILRLWNPRTRQTVKTLALSSRLDPAAMALAPDGRLLVSQENKSDPSLRHVQAHRLTIVSTKNLTIIKTVDFGAKNDLNGLLFEPGDNQHVIVKMTSLIPYEGDYIFGQARFAWLNLVTGKVDRTVPYEHAIGADALRLSADKRILVCLFSNEEDEKGQSGVLDVLDLKTLKSLWHLKGTDKSPVGFPCFFCSARQLVVATHIYDIKGKVHKPLLVPGDARLECLGDVPQHPPYAFFLTRQGLELWNISTNKAVRRWPSILSEGVVALSPSLHLLSFEENNKIQFWKFDPKWLR